MIRRKLHVEILDQRNLFAGDPIDVLDRAAVVLAYQQQYKPYVDVPVEWTGSVAGCVAGTVSQRTNDATQNVLNYLRNMSGLESVILDPELSDKAMKAALIMKAQDALSHSPDSTWACYTEEGAAAAGKSNLFLGSTGPRAMVGYVEDPGDGNIGVGHRRSIQNPFIDRMGSGSTSSTNALYVIGDYVDRTSPDWISWPPQGYVPTELVFPRWSLSKVHANFEEAQVEMKIAGQSIPIIVHPVLNGYGPHTLVWEPVNELDLGGAEEFTFEISVSNVIIDGSAESFQYKVMPIHPGPPVRTVEAATSDKSGMPHGEFVIINVMANDDINHPGWSPVADASLDAIIVNQPDNGQLLNAIDNPGLFFYYPDPGFAGVDTFTYRWSNLAEGRVSNLVMASVTVLADSTKPWQNPLQSTDVNFDGDTTAIDALRIINFLSRRGSDSSELEIDIPAGDFPPSYCDVNGDGFASVSDALTIINKLGRDRPTAAAEMILIAATITPLDHVLETNAFDISWLIDDFRNGRKRTF